MKNFTPRKVRKFVILFLFLATAIISIGLFKNILLLSIFGCCILAVVVVVDIVFYRCHNCGRFLGRDSVKFCPHCGSEVE